jgi:hypothetical protein
MLSPLVTRFESNVSRWPNLNLTAVTAIVAVADLLWGRTGSRLLLPQGGFSSGLNNALMALGSYLGHLTGVMALTLLVSALANSSVRQRIFPRPLQVSLIFIAALFVLLASRALLSPVGERLTLYIKISYGFMSAFVLLGVLRLFIGKHPSGKRHRRLAVGLIMFAVPGILYAAASFVDRSGQLQSGQMALTIAQWGQWAALLAGVSAGLLLSPPSRGLMRPGAFAIASAAGVIGAVVTFALLLLRYDLVQNVAAVGLNIETPRFTDRGGSLFALLFSAAAGSTLFGLVSLLGSRSDWRLIGYGLVLITTGGYQLSSPGLCASSLVGLMAMALGVFAVSNTVHASNEQGSQGAQGTNQHVNPG